MTYDAFRHFADSWGLVLMGVLFAQSYYDRDDPRERHGSDQGRPVAAFDPQLQHLAGRQERHPRRPRRRGDDDAVEVGDLDADPGGAHDLPPDRVRWLRGGLLGARRAGGPSRPDGRR